MARVEELATTLTPEEVRAINTAGLHVGRVVDERKADFETGDFLVRNVLGADRDTGAIAVDDEIEVGTTVQFHLRDAAAAHDDLDRLLCLSEEALHAEAALLFTCNGRGSHLFGTTDHDAGLVTARLGEIPTAGMFAAGELGPIGGRNELHSFTASMLLLRERR
jgi:small ligand-binding sensory domain FIST